MLPVRFRPIDIVVLVAGALLLLYYTWQLFGVNPTPAGISGLLLGLLGGHLSFALLAIQRLLRGRPRWLLVLGLAMSPVGPILIALAVRLTGSSAPVTPMISGYTMTYAMTVLCLGATFGLLERMGARIDLAGEQS